MRAFVGVLLHYIARAMKRFALPLMAVLLPLFIWGQEDAAVNPYKAAGYLIAGKNLLLDVGYTHRTERSHLVEFRYGDFQTDSTTFSSSPRSNGILGFTFNMNWRLFTPRPWLSLGLDTPVSWSNLELKSAKSDGRWDGTEGRSTWEFGAVPTLRIGYHSSVYAAQDFGVGIGAGPTLFIGPQSLDPRALNGNVFRDEALGYSRTQLRMRYTVEFSWARLGNSSYLSGRKVRLSYSPFQKELNYGGKEVKVGGSFLFTYAAILFYD